MCCDGLLRAFVDVLALIEASVKSPVNNIWEGWLGGGEFIVILEGGAVRVVGCFTKYYMRAVSHDFNRKNR